MQLEVEFNEHWSSKSTRLISWGLVLASIRLLAATLRERSSWVFKMRENRLAAGTPLTALPRLRSWLEQGLLLLPKNSTPALGRSGLQPWPPGLAPCLPKSVYQNPPMTTGLHFYVFQGLGYCLSFNCFLKNCCVFLNVQYIAM